MDQEGDDHFEGKELSGSQYLENSIDASCSIKELVHCEDDLDVCRGFVDECDPEWKVKVREEVHHVIRG